VEVEWHQGDRLVIRRLVSRANPLMSAEMNCNAVVKKDLYVLKLPDTAQGVSLSYILGLLNSSLWSYLYLVRSAAATKDDFRQVSLEGLRSLPMPVGTPCQDEVEDLVAEIESAVARGADFSQLDAQLDSLVFSIYGIPERECRLVRTFLAAPG